IFIAVTTIIIANIICKCLAFVQALILAPKGEAIILTKITIIAGIHKTSPVNSLPAVVPIEEKKVIPKEVAIVILVGIFKIVIITGTSKNAPPAPTIPAPIPMIVERRLDKIILYFKSALTFSISLSDRGVSIKIAASNARIP